MQESSNFNQTPPKRLYRSRADRMIAGVCAGLAEYSSLDPVLIRLIFVLLGFMGGLGVILYIIGIIIIPENPDQQPRAETKSKKSDHSVFWGALLILIGALLLIQQMNFIPPINLWMLPWYFIWALLFIGLGIFLVLKNGSASKVSKEEPVVSTEPESEEETAQPRKTLFRSRDDRMLAGVCGGLAKYFNVDPTIVRLIYVLLTLFSKGLGILAYIILIIAVPEEKPQTFSNGESHE